MAAPSASSSNWELSSAASSVVRGQWVHGGLDETPDTQAFEALYREYFAFSWSALRRLGVPAAQVDDAAQELWLTVYRKLDTLQPDASVRAWLYGIARRIASHQRRAAFRNRRKVAALAITRSDQSEQPQARREAALTLETFLAGLDESKRVAFVLSELEGWSAPEIAEVAGTNPNTIYSRVRLARQQLRAHLRADDAAQLDGTLDAAREATKAPRGAANRCWAALLPKLTAAAAPPVITAGAGAALAKTLAGLGGIKSVLLGAALGSVALVGLDAALPPGAEALKLASQDAPRTDEPTARGGEARLGETAPARARDSEVSPTEITVPTRGDNPAVVGQPPPSTEPRADEPEPASKPSLADQTAMLEGAKQALAQDAPGRALTAVRSHARQFPNSPLVDVRTVLEVDALCALGRVTEAKQKAEAFATAHPGSAAAARLAFQCDAKAPAQ